MASANTSGPASGSKFQAAVDKATNKGKEAGGDGAEALTVPLPREAQAMIVKPDAAMIAAMQNDSTMEFAPQVHSIEKGEMVTGYLEGKGPPTTFTQFDPVSKTETSRMVDTWILASAGGGLRISILSSIQLDKKLPPFIGGVVSIFRGEDKKTGKGFRVADYMVGGKKRSDGVQRSWVQKPIIDVDGNAIDGPSPVNQLSDGSSSPPSGGEDAAA